MFSFINHGECMPVWPYALHYRNSAMSIACNCPKKNHARVTADLKRARGLHHSVELQVVPIDSLYFEWLFTEVAFTYLPPGKATTRIYTEGAMGYTINNRVTQIPH